MNKYYNLFLDDERYPKDVKWVRLPLVEWVIVRNYDEFVKTIQENGVPERVSFDHDLAVEHYGSFDLSASIGIRYEKFKEKTGYDCAKWLAYFCVDKKIPLPLYYVHTLNSVGRLNIVSIMESARKAMSYGNQDSQSKTS